MKFTDEELSWLRYLVGCIANGAAGAAPSVTSYALDARLGESVLVKLGGRLGWENPEPSPYEALRAKDAT